VGDKIIVEAVIQHLREYALINLPLTAGEVKARPWQKRLVLMAGLTVWPYLADIDVMYYI
jgi:hypothetical protein